MPRFEKIKRDCAGHYDKLLFDRMLILEGLEIEPRCEIQFLARACYTALEIREEREIYFVWLCFLHRREEW
jgi:hypothetical protein